MATRWLMVIVVIICYSKVDIKNNVCWALCRNDGADTGSYEQKTNNCICGYRKNFKEITAPVIHVNGKPSPKIEMEEED